MAITQITPRFWPQQARQCQQDWAEHGFCVIALQYATTPDRADARLAIRAAILELCQLLLSCQPEQLKLYTQPGLPPQLSLSDQHSAALHISISHEDSMSVAVVSNRASVGIDLVKVDPDFEWQAVAALYLPPETFWQAIERTDSVANQHANANIHLALPEKANSKACQSNMGSLRFFRQWAQSEAILKLAGLPLKEWSAQRQSELLRLRPFRFYDLQLPPHYCGTLCINH